MALATRCPHCHTTFRVAADQLKLRGGIVRCGTCQQVFDGNATLVDMDAPVVTQAPAPAPAPAPEPASAPEPVPAPAPPPAPAFPAFVEPEPEFDVLPPTFSPLEYGNGPPAWYSARQTKTTLQTVPPPDAFPALFRDDPAPVAPAPVVVPVPAPVVQATPPEPAPEPVPEPLPEPAPLPEPVPEPEPIVEAAPVIEPLLVQASAAPARVEPTFDGEPPAPRRPSAQIASRRLRNAAAQAAAAPAPEAIIVPAPAPLPAPDSIIDSNGEQYAPLPEQNSLLRMESSPPRKSAGIEYSPNSVLPGQGRGKKGNRRAPQVPAAAPAPKPAQVPAPRPVEADEPEFIKLGRAREENGRLRAQLMAGGCVLLLVLLAVQLFTSSRDVLAARYPALRPVALSLCAAFNCRVELPTQIDTLAIETGELQTLGNDAFTFTTLLRNQGTLVQAWPSLELTLHDANDKPLVRRVFTPRDYLPNQAGAKGVVPLSASGFAAHTEQPVKLSFVLNGLKPSGYHIAIFYP